jgi:hypothetical protein
MELQVLATIAATVYREEIRTSDPDELRQRLVTRLFDRYAVLTSAAEKTRFSDPRSQ